MNGLNPFYPKGLRPFSLVKPCSALDTPRLFQVEVANAYLLLDDATNGWAEADLAARPSHHETAEDHDHDDFESVALALPATDSAEALAERLGRAAEAAGVLRLKGFAAVGDRPMRLVVQGVGRRVTHHFDRPWKPGEPRDGRLVVIGLEGFDRAAVEAALNG